MLTSVVLLSSCTSSTPTIPGIPSDLPSIPLYGAARTPAHRMKHGDYPFDANGNYVTSWAAEGGASAGPSDYKSSKHYDDAPPPRRSTSSSTSKRSVQESPPKKVVASTSTKSSPPKKTTPTKESSAPPKKSASGGSTKHVVKSSDTLFGLAKKYGTTVAKIKAANGLTSDVLRDGRTLSIPK